MEVSMKRLIALLLLIPVVQALDMPELDQVKEDYNSNIENIPGFVRKLIGTERINCYVETEGGDEVILSAITEKGMIEELKLEELEEPTMIVHTSEATIEAILEAEDPVAMLKQALKNDELTYKAQGFTKKLKWGFNSMLMKVSGLFIRIIK
jgi:hypothetical protein